RPAVLIADFELQSKGAPPTVQAALAEEPQVPAIPAIPEHRADSVFTRSQERCDVVGLVLQPVAVGCPPGREELVADPSAVEMDLVQALARHVETGGAHGAAHTKSPPQERRRRGEAVRRARSRADPPGRP